MPPDRAFYGDTPAALGKEKVALLLQVDPIPFLYLARHL